MARPRTRRPVTALSPRLYIDDTSPGPEEIAAMCAVIRAENYAAMRAVEQCKMYVKRRHVKHWSYNIWE